VIDTGSIGLLTRHSAGMITINSTSGLSAIYHGVPLMVLGDAIYSNEELAVCARGEPDFDEFWTHISEANITLKRLYINWIKVRSLERGDFYANADLRRTYGSIVKSGAFTP
jgi:capsular polysaccharide export protein